MRATALRKLQEKGVKLAFDDFGTGYASLIYLTRFPLARIKIDRSFVGRITDDASAAAIVRSLIAMAHNLGIEVIAEEVRDLGGPAVHVDEPTDAHAVQHVAGAVVDRPLDDVEVLEARHRIGPRELVALESERHVLLVEVASLATDLGAAAEIIEKLKSQHPELARVDQIWAINTVALKDEDYSPAHLIWPLEEALELDLARNGGA